MRTLFRIKYDFWGLLCLCVISLRIADQFQVKNYKRAFSLIYIKSKGDFSLFQLYSRWQGPRQRQGKLNRRSQTHVLMATFPGLKVNNVHSSSGRPPCPSSLDLCFSPTCSFHHQEVFIKYLIVKAFFRYVLQWENLITISKAYPQSY